MHRSRIAVVVAAFASVIVAQAALAETRTVTIQSFRFDPPSVDVKAGDEVQFVNKDVTEHTATAGNKAFDSKSIKPGESWKWKAGPAGQYAYNCSFHNGMKGVINVKP
jgi:plastocyanin